MILLLLKKPVIHHALACGSTDYYESITLF